MRLRSIARGEARQRQRRDDNRLLTIARHPDIGPHTAPRLFLRPQVTEQSMQQNRDDNFDDQDRAYRLREMYAGANNVLRLAMGAKKNDDASNEGLRSTGRAAVDLLNQAADTVKANEARAEALMQKAIDQLASAEARIRGLEARAAAAEARAAEAESRTAEAEAWVRQVHQVVLDRFDDVRALDSLRTRTGYAA